MYQILTRIEDAIKNANTNYDRCGIKGTQQHSGTWRVLADALNELKTFVEYRIEKTHTKYEPVHPVIAKITSGLDVDIVIVDSNRTLQDLIVTSKPKEVTKIEIQPLTNINYHE